MAYTSKAMLSMELTLDGVTHVIAEGDKVRNLIYRLNGVEYEIEEGTVVILGAEVMVSSVPNVTTDGNFDGCVCNPESTFDEYVTVNRMLIDHSTKFDSAVTTLKLKDIVSIKTVVHKDGTEEAGKVYVVENHGKRYEDVAQAISEAKPGDTIVATADLTAKSIGTSGPNTAAYVLPEGVTFDGKGHTITVDAATASGSAGSAQGHVFQVDKAGSVIKNVKIVGCDKIKSGIVAYGSACNLTIENVDISNVGTVGVQVAGGVVTAKNLTISGTAWGAVNVDHGSPDAGTPHFTMESGDLSSEKVEIYTELTEEDCVTADGYLKVIGVGTSLKNFVYYTTSMAKLGVLYGVKDGKTYVYETQGDADADLTVPEKFPTTPVVE